MEVTLIDTDVHHQLLKRLSLALRIARRTVQFLGAKGFTGAELPEGNFAAEKPLSEAAMLLYAAKEQRSDPIIKTDFDGLVQDLLPYARSKQMRWDVLRYPSVCLQLATPHILLAQLGYEDSQFNALLGQAAAASASRGHELVPYRELEVIWLQSLWTSDDPGIPLKETARKTALGNPIDLLNATREDAYAHTHALMYYTNFGNWQKKTPRPAEEFLNESAVVLARALIAEDYDLAAEALMAWPLTSTAWSPSAAFGFRVLASLEDKVGFLPAGRSASKRLMELTGEEKTKYALASCYHTAFVMGMLCAVSLKSGTPSPDEIAGPPFSPTLIENLQACIPETGAYWEKVFQSLSLTEKARLGGFLFNVAMVRSSQKGEFAQMARLLEMAVQNGLADTTLCAQSAELLSRIACSDVCSA